LGYPRLRAAFNNGSWKLNYSLVSVENRNLVSDLEIWRKQLNGLSEPRIVQSVDLVVYLDKSDPSSFEKFGGLISSLFEQIKCCSTQEINKYECEPIFLSLGYLLGSEIELGYGDGFGVRIEDGPMRKALEGSQNEFGALDWHTSPLRISFTSRQDRPPPNTICSENQ
jgi:hypothetical protein